MNYLLHCRTTSSLRANAIWLATVRQAATTEFIQISTLNSRITIVDLVSQFVFILQRFWYLIVHEAIWLSCLISSPSLPVHGRTCAYGNFLLVLSISVRARLINLYVIGISNKRMSACSSHIRRQMVRSIATVAEQKTERMTTLIQSICHLSAIETLSDFNELTKKSDV